MYKQKEYKIADSNLALFGTQLEKDVKEASAKTEVAWTHAGKEAGLLIWRIEKFHVKAATTAVGTFYENDSYIVLHTYKHENELKFDIHFWLGRTTSQDEAGTAAYKTVELDNFLHEKAVQHREVQDHESELFLSYFKEKGGVRILEGGIESGFHHVEPTKYVPRLLWLKGKKNVRVREVEKKAASLNDGDCFILDAGLKLYQWNGRHAGLFEKTKAAQLSRTIDSERDGKAQILVQEHGQEEPEFWELLGGKGDVKSGDDIPDDDEWETEVKKVLLQFSDQTGKTVFTKISEGTDIKFDHLNTGDGYIFDLGKHIYVWLGKGASTGEKKGAMKYAQDYMREHDRPMVLPISLINEGKETPQFKQAFHH